jgi:hypothetical protein
VYKVQVTADDCLSEFSNNQTLIVTRAEVNEANTIATYPNPATDWLTISLGELSDTNYTTSNGGVRKK